MYKQRDNMIRLLLKAMPMKADPFTEAERWADYLQSKNVISCNNYNVKLDNIDKSMNSAFCFQGFPAEIS